MRVLGVSGAVSVSGTPDQRIAAVASLQRGRASRDQLRAVGITDTTIDRRRATGFLHREHRGVYVVGHSAPLPYGSETSALLACGEHAVLSHRTAATLWGLLPDGGGVIHITIRGRDGPRPSGTRVHQTKTLNRSDVRIVEGLPVTSAARTLVDIASELDPEGFEWAVNEALVQKLVTEPELRRAAKRARGRAAARILRGLLDRQREPAITRSKAEQRFLSLIRLAQLPEPRMNLRVHGYLIDAYWPDLGVIVEIQGYKFHSGRAAFERDARKSAKLTAAGLTVCYVTWRQMEEEPYAVVARIAQMLVRSGTQRAAQP